MKLKVMKSDGVVEEYLHTKVVGVISNAVSGAGEADVCIAEHLAEVVTYFLHQGEGPRCVTSDEIFSIVKAVLTVTGYEDAAVALNEHRYRRQLKRCRVEVVSVDAREMDDADAFYEAQQAAAKSPWSKSRIVSDLVSEQGLCRQTARVVASMVEEKIFNMGVTLVPASLVKQLVLGDTAAVLRAERQLARV
jgi:hypothetical protein